MWNPDYTKAFNDRTIVNARARRDQDMVVALLDYYGNGVEGCIAWINDYAITYDPRNQKPKPKTMPFLMFPRQEQFVRFIFDCIETRDPGLAEKCRDAGMTWLACAISVWLWRFVPGAAVGWGSRKEELVDRLGDPSSLFEKMRMIIRDLPDWMLPVGFDQKKHMSFMKILNPETGASIIGECGDNIGRGGRTMIYFKDESAWYERPELIEAALGDNTEVQIDISSVHGSNNVFYRRRMAGDLWTPGETIPKGKVKVFVFDWRDDPRKTQEWYDQRRNRAEAEGLLHVFAQEVDRDYSSSLDRIIIRPEWSRACIDAHLKIPGFGADGEKVGAQDVADGGGDKNALAMRTGLILRFVEHWGGEAGEAAKRAVPECLNAGMQELYYDAIGVGAGFKVGINHIEKQKEDGGVGLGNLRVMPWFAGDPPLNPTDNIIPGDDKSPTNEDFFENLKAQAWWSLRTRIYKTYRAVTFGDKYPIDELISFDSRIPLLQQLLMELSQAVHCYSKKGKTMIDKQPDGTPSPNMADSVVMVYYPTRVVSILDVL